MTHPKNNRRGFTAVELAVVLLVIAILVSVTMVQVDRQRQERLREASAANLKSMYEVFSQTATPKRDGLIITWPVKPPVEYDRPLAPLSSAPGHLIPEPTFAYPTGGFPRREQWSAIGFKWRLLASNPTALISPAHPDAKQMLKDAFDDRDSAYTDDSYWYLGYALPNEEAGLAFVEAYKKSVETTGKPPILYVLSLKVRPFNAGDGEKLTELVRLRRHASAGSNTPPSTIPIVIERPGLLKGGANVLFTDGHIEFIKYLGKWPMTGKFIKALESLDELKDSPDDPPEK